MTDDKAKPQPESPPADDQDVEGHNMMINPTLAGELARARSRDIDREVKERNRSKEAKR